MNSSSRAAAVLSQMTPAEKLALIAGEQNMFTRGVPRLNVRRLRMADASMGLRDDTIDAMAFPAFIALAATWNRERAADYGAAVGEEFRAARIDVVLGPGVNRYRVHECGRNFEYLGEDPILAASLVAPYIRAVQSCGVAATVKHFAANNTDWHRCVSNSVVDERTLREVYLLPFEAAVKDGAVDCLMTSYNLVNGEYAGEHRHLLSDVLLGEWGFRGLIMSDWEGLWNPGPALTGGLHLEMPKAKAFDPAAIRTIIEEGAISQSDIDAKALRILELTFRLEERQLEVPDRGIGRSDAHRAVALEVAREGIVLLRNEGDLLPLYSNAKVALLGPTADPTPTSGGGAAAVRAIDRVSIAGGIAAVAPGCRLVRGTTDDGTAGQAREADIAVVCVGYSGEREREGCDRPYALPAEQVALIKRVSRTARRTVVVVVAGGAVEMTSWIDDVDAIVHVWYPGEIGAEALAEILFGTVVPSGRLPISIERSYADRAEYANYLPEGAELYPDPDYVSQDAPPFDVRYEEGVFCGYRHLEAVGVEPLFAFGHGLSYTSFTYDALTVAHESDGVSVGFSVKNTGSRDAKETAQLYVRPASADLAATVPMRLAGFEKRAIASGETARCSVSIPMRSFAMWDGDAGGWRVPAGSYRIEIGSSSRDVRLATEIDLKETRISSREKVL